jgi:hypothetical protein
MNAFPALEAVGQFIASGGLAQLTADVPKAQAAVNVAIEKTIEALAAWKAVNAAATPIVAAVKKAE